MKRRKDEEQNEEMGSSPPSKKIKTSLFDQTALSVQTEKINSKTSNEISVKTQQENEAIAKSVNKSKYNKYLPPSINKEVDEEIERWRKEIFDKFSQFESTKDWNALSLGIEMLRRYVEVDYPLELTEKEALCKILYQAIVDPTIDMSVQQRCCLSMSSLLKKKETLNITFAWRPIYEILDKTYFSKYRTATYTPKDHSSAMVSLVKKMKRYFDKNATDEMLEEFRPQMCVHDHLLFKAQGFLCLFLPTNSGRFDWLDEIITYWSWVGLYPTYDNGFVSLLASLAEDNPGAIDWEKYIPLLFTNILRCLDLPVGNSPPSMYDEYPIEECSLFGSFEYAKTLLLSNCAKLIVWLLSSKNNTMDYLKRLFKSIETFFHPSNEGAWTPLLADFLLILNSKLGKRLTKERSEAGANIPEWFKLTDEQCKEFVNILLPICITAMYSKSSQMTMCANHALKHLSYICPDIIFPTLLERCFHALQTLTETHQAVSALETLSVVIFPLLQPKIYPEGAKYLEALMNLSLPGLDTNDMRKTWSTFKFYTALLVCIPIIGPQEMEHNENAPQVIHFFEDWCLQFLDRTFVILQNQGPVKKEDIFDGVPPSIFWGFFDLFFMQLSDELHTLCIKKVLNFITTELHINAKKNIGHMCASASYANPEKTLQMFVPALYQNLVDQNGNLLDLTDTEIEWWVHMLGQVVYRTGKHILKYKNELTRVIHLTWNHKEKKIVKCAGKLIRNLFRTLTFYYPLDLRHVNPSTWNSYEFQNEHWKTWSNFMNTEDIEINWHVPSAEELDFAVELSNTFLELAIGKIQSYISALNEQRKPPFSGKIAKNYLLFIRYIIRGTGTIWPEVRKDIIPSLCRFTPVMNLKAGLEQVELSRFKYTFYEVGMLFHELCEAVLKSKRELPMVLTTLARAIMPIFCTRSGFTRSSYRQKKSSYRFIKAHNFKSYNPAGGKFPRYMLVKRTQLQLINRCVLHTEALPFTKMHELLINDLVRLSLSSYSAVRRKAQDILAQVSKRLSPEVTKQYLPKVIDILCAKDSTDDQRTGAIYVLERPYVTRIVSEDWNLLSKVMISLCSTSHIEKDTVQNRVGALYEIYFHTFYELPINDENSLRIYHKLISDLLKLVEGTNLHWKYLTMIASLLLILVRSDKTLFPLEATKWIVLSLNSDIEKIRNIAQEALTLILCQYKPLQPRKTISMKGKTLVDFWDNVEDIKTKEEWNNTHFYEKNWFGWNVCPNKAKVYIYDEKEIEIAKPVDKIADKRNELIKTLNEIFNNEFLKKFFELLVIRDDSFSETNAQLFKGLFQILRDDFFYKCLPFMEELLKQAGSGKQEEVFYISTCAEIVGGLFRGVKHWDFDKQDEVFKKLFPLLALGMEKCTLNCVDEWCEALEFSLCDKDPRRCRWVKEFLLERAKDIFTTDVLTSPQLRHLKYLYSYVNAVYWRDPKIQISLLDFLKKHLSNPYEQVRENISLFLSGIFKALWKPKRKNLFILNVEEHAINPKLETFLNEMFKDFKREAEKQNELKLQKIEDVTFKSLSKTIISWIFGLFSTHVPHYALDRMTDLLDLLAIIQEHADEEILNLVKADLFMIACYPFGPKTAKRILKYLHEFTPKCANWKVRESCLQFLQIFGYKQQFYLENEQDMLFELIVDRLRDNRLEIRELACNTLAGFIRCSQFPFIEKLSTKFKQWASVHVTRKKKRKLNEKEVIQRHSGVLGLAAIIKAFPYHVPDFLPELLVTLANHSNDVQPISDTVRNTFAEFWKMHGDTWQLQKRKFTEDQLVILTDLLISPSYYA